MRKRLNGPFPPSQPRVSYSINVLYFRNHLQSRTVTHPLFVHLNDRLLGSKGHLGGGGMSITRWRLFSCSRVDYSIHPMELFTDPSGSAETLKLLVSTATRNNYVLYATANTLQSKIAC